MFGSIACRCLAEEWKSWRKNHSHGFVAKSETMPDETMNLMILHCIIPKKVGVVESVG